MIHVKATIWGEPDVLPFTRIFDYGSADEEIFFSSAAMIQEKLARKMKINANEALVTYCVCVVKSIRAGRSESDIQEDAKEIYDLLLLKETGMLCVSCSEAYSNREGFNNDVQEKLK